MHDTPQQPPYELMDHTADLALSVWGATLEELFANAAAAMFAQMTGVAGMGRTTRRSITVEGGDTESLLVAWLSELLYLHETQHETYRRFHVSFPAPGLLAGSAEGRACSIVERPIKAVTYHRLEVQHGGDLYRATITFDV
jgi:SHS2 domain-containing protein